MDVIAAGRNLGAPARTLGVALASTPYVAFSDDDSWWGAGALGRASAAMDAHAHLGLVAARIEVGQRQLLDPVLRRDGHQPAAG